MRAAHRSPARPPRLSAFAGDPIAITKLSSRQTPLTQFCACEMGMSGLANPAAHMPTRQGQATDILGLPSKPPALLAWDARSDAQPLGELCRHPAPGGKDSPGRLTAAAAQHTAVRTSSPSF